MCGCLLQRLREHEGREEVACWLLLRQVLFFKVQGDVERKKQQGKLEEEEHEGESKDREREKSSVKRSCLRWLGLNQDRGRKESKP